MTMTIRLTKPERERYQAFRQAFKRKYDQDYPIDGSDQPAPPSTRSGKLKQRLPNADANVAVLRRVCKMGDTDEFKRRVACCFRNSVLVAEGIDLSVIVAWWPNLQNDSDLDARVRVMWARVAGGAS